ncbi:protein kinase subdomain-containing protein PKL/CAK/CAK-fungal1 [Gymnopilus junonius]|uniref:Protein kinase subdomain-containing protein PKL/CAK/CAK-fungal1 n=1 Tax=Gymnopilus junonius TaxID=109634 RepID=A0A9P5TIB1_GYMJU|nr:protein kinase subdomain-containing protein PKL/CAK/CAK-fungal1 [Gymnopilus junonius]
MPTKSEEDEEGASPSSTPAHLRSPVPELRGLKLFRYELNRRFDGFIRRLCFFAFNGGKFTKFGPRVRLEEALSMDFIARNTTIRVPRVLDVFSIRRTMYIVQERINGPILEDVWHRLSIEEQHSSVLQVKDCLDQLRALKPQQPGRVQAVDGSGLIDSRLDSGEWGPFDNHSDFHQFLNHDVLRAQSQTYPRVQEPLSKVEGKQYKTVFSHGDLGPHNIIWKDGRAVIIDWERAGWFPEYWDYSRAYAARGYMKDWWKMFSEVVDKYDDELELEVRISEYFET